jgi:hypothetical protein
VNGLSDGEICQKDDEAAREKADWAKKKMEALQKR